MIGTVRSAGSSPAELPLSGGQAGATVKLHPLLCAQLRGPGGWFHRISGPTAAPRALGLGVPRSEYVPVPIVAFLVEHPLAGPILIDTGVHASANVDPRQNLGWFGALMARGITMDRDQTAAALCRARGVDPASISLIVMTHLHFDHAGGLADFPSATVIVSEPEWRSAIASTSAIRGYVRAQLDPRLSYQTVDFQMAKAIRRDPFDKALDLFADGSVTLVCTPGHSSGHMSVILRLRDREALIAGDAIYTMATLRDDERPWRTENRQAFERSLKMLRTYDRENPTALIIPGHDMNAWEQLDSSYA